MVGIANEDIMHIGKTRTVPINKIINTNYYYYYMYGDFEQTAVLYRRWINVVHKYVAADIKHFRKTYLCHVGLHNR